MFDYDSHVTKGVFFNKHEMTSRVKLFRWWIPIAYDVRYKVRPELKTLAGTMLCLGAVLISAVVAHMEKPKS